MRVFLFLRISRICWSKSGPAASGGSMERTEEERRERESVCVSVCVISKVHRIFVASRLIVLFPLFSTATELTRYCVWMIGEWWHKRGCFVDDQVGRSIHRVVLVAGCFSGSAGSTSVISGRRTLCQVEGDLRVHVLFDRFTKRASFTSSAP